MCLLFFFQPIEKFMVSSMPGPAPRPPPSRPSSAPVLANCFLGSNIHFLQAWAKNRLGSKDICLCHFVNLLLQQHLCSSLHNTITPPEPLHTLVDVNLFPNCLLRFAACLQSSTSGSSQGPLLAIFLNITPAVKHFWVLSRSPTRNFLE